MILEFDNYKIVTDEKQFIVQEKKVVQESKLTKAENVGKEYYIDIAYCTMLDFALKFLSNRVLLQNDDLDVILDKLKVLQSKIEAFTSMLRLKV
jgi:hypothetical protein